MEKKLKSYGIVSKIRDYCHVKIKVKRILKFNLYQKSTNISFVIYANMESIIEKIQTYHKNPGKLFHIKIKQTYTEVNEK